MSLKRNRSGSPIPNDGKPIHEAAAEANAEIQDDLHLMKEELRTMKEGLLMMNEQARTMYEEVRTMNEQVRTMNEELCAMNCALTGKPCPAGFDPDMFTVFADEARGDKATLKRRISEKEGRISEKERRISEEKQRISEEKQRISEKEQRISEKEQLIVHLALKEPPSSLAIPPPTLIGPMRTLIPGAMGTLPAGVTEEVVVVEVKDGVLGIQSSELFVRTRYYPAVWKTAHDALQNGKQSIVVVLGQPGIGKTIGVGNYSVLRCLEEFPHAVVVIAELSNSFVVISPNLDGVPRTCLRYASAEAFERHVLKLDKSTTLFFVHDVKTARNTQEFKVSFAAVEMFRRHFANMCVMILSSPQEGNSAYAEKIGMKLFEVALPTWSSAELVAGRFISNSDDHSLDLRGGVPRSYMHDDKVIRSKQDVASVTFDIMNMRSLEFSGKCSSKLVQLLPDEEFSRFVMMAPVSRGAAKIIADRFGSQLHAHFVSMLRFHGAYDGHIVEWWFLSLLRSMAPTVAPKETPPASHPPQRCNIELQFHGFPAGSSTGNLYDVAYKHEHLHEILTFPGSTMQDLLGKVTQFASLPLATSRQHVVLIPETSNFPVVDAVVLTRAAKKAQWSMVAFQCTVGDTHPAAVGAAEELRVGLLKANIELAHFVYVGLGAGGVFRGVTKQQTTKDGDPFFPSKQCRMDVAMAKTRQ